MHLAVLNAGREVIGMETIGLDFYTVKKDIAEIYCKRWKAGRGLGTRLYLPNNKLSSLVLAM